MHQKFRVQGQAPIYEQENFEELCKKTGCIDLFNSVLSPQKRPRLSNGRHELSMVCTLAIMHRLVYGLSQWANYYQKDYETYLSYSGANQNAVEMARNVGDSSRSQ